MAETLLSFTTDEYAGAGSQRAHDDQLVDRTSTSSSTQCASAGVAAIPSWLMSLSYDDDSECSSIPGSLISAADDEGSDCCESVTTNHCSPWPNSSQAGQPDQLNGVTRLDVNSMQYHARYARHLMRQAVAVITSNFYGKLQEAKLLRLQTVTTCRHRWQQPSCPYTLPPVLSCRYSCSAGKHVALPTSLRCAKPDAKPTLSARRPSIGYALFSTRIC